MSDLPEGIIRTPEGIYVLRDDTHLSRWIELHKRLDVAEDQIAHFSRFIPEGGVVIDAGSSLGDHAATYAKLVGPTGKVFAFEPNPLAFECLKRNLQGFRCVLPLNLALGAIHGSARLCIQPNAGASFVVHEVGAEGSPIVKAALNSIGIEFDRLDFIHLDAEGFEIFVLQGAWELLKKFRPVIVMEVNIGCLARYGLDQNAVSAELDKLGYRWEEAYPDHGPHMAQRDIIAFPK